MVKKFSTVTVENLQYIYFFVGRGDEFDLVDRGFVSEKEVFMFGLLTESLFVRMVCVFA